LVLNRGCLNGTCFVKSLFVNAELCKEFKSGRLWGFFVS